MINWGLSSRSSSSQCKRVTKSGSQQNKSPQFPTLVAVRKSEGIALLLSTAFLSSYFALARMNEPYSAPRKDFCIFWPNLNTHSGRIWTPVLIQVEHWFWFQAEHFFGFSRIGVQHARIAVQVARIPPNALFIQSDYPFRPFWKGYVSKENSNAKFKRSS